MAHFNLLRFHFTLLLAAGGSRVPISTENLTTGTELYAEGADSKSITYIRHGQSTGNANIMGMIRMRSLLNFHADGILMPKGEQQVKDRVDLMGTQMLARVADAQVILVSPLRRALGTAVLFVAHAHHRNIALRRKLIAQSDQVTEYRTDMISASTGVVHADCSVDSKTEGYLLPSDHHWPSMQVVAELREKIKSESEIPGSGTGKTVQEYLKKLGKKLGSQLFCNETALYPMLQDLLLSYAADKERTLSWTTHHWNISIPTDGVKFGQLIRAFTKDILPARQEKRLVVVGHSGWARFAFAHLLPLLSGDVDVPLDNLATFTRTTVELNNAGILPLRYHEGSYTFEWPDEPRPENNFNEKQKVNMFTLLPDARVAGVIPDDTMATQFYLPEEDQIVTISASKSNRVAYCTRSSAWGSPKTTLHVGRLTTYVTMYKAKEVEIHETVLAKRSLKTISYRYMFPDSNKRRCFYDIVRWYQDDVRGWNALRPHCEGAVHVG